MNLLVGGTGFVGGHVVEFLYQQGEISKGTFRKGSRLKTLDSSGVQLIETDLLEHHSLHEAMEGVDTVYSMASPMPGRETEFMKYNTEAILNILEAATEAGVKTIVHLSTLDVCGFRSRQVPASAPVSPEGEYQMAKAEAERLLLESAKRNSIPRVVIVRSARALGSRDWSFTTPLLRMARVAKVVLPRSSRMSFSHPRDIARALFSAATGSTRSGSVFQVKSFDASPEDFATALIPSAGMHAEVRTEGMLSRSRLPQYTTSQLRAALSIGTEPGWGELAYKPEVSMQGACEEIAGWYKKEPWASEDA